ncbi:MAG: PAS domain-containing protein [Spirochaetaceae bacterium]
MPSTISTPIFTEHLTQEDGLSDSSVRAIYQDSRGFMWFGSWSGLQRYDGKRLKLYINNPNDPDSISGNTITFIHEDSKGYIWVGTVSNGINSFDPETEIFTRFQNNPDDPNTIADTISLCIWESSDGILWFGNFTGGMSKYNSEDGTFTNYINDPDNNLSIGGKRVNSIIEDDEGFLWLYLSNFGFERFDPKTEEFKHFPVTGPAKMSPWGQFRSVKDVQGKIWTVSGRGLFLVDPILQTIKLVHLFEAGHLSYSLIYDDEVLWIASKNLNRGGLVRYDIKSNKVEYYKNDPNNPYSINANLALTLLKSSDGLVWAGLRFKGIDRFSIEPSAFNNFKQSPSSDTGFQGDLLYPPIEDNYGRIWIPTNRGINVILQNGSVLFYKNSDLSGGDSSIPNQIWKSISKDKNGRLWVLGTKTLLSLNIGDKLPSPENLLDKVENLYLELPLLETGTLSKNNNLKGMVVKDNFLWMLTTLGLYSFDLHKEVGRIYSPDNKETTDTINDFQSITIDPADSSLLWLTSWTKGLVSFNLKNSKFTFYRSGDKGSLSSSEVYSVAFDSNGTQWVGTNGGLNRRTTEGYEYFGISTGFDSDAFHFIVPDLKGSLWLGTRNGLKYFNPTNNSIQNFDRINGVGDFSYNDGAGILKNNGSIVIKSTTTMTIINPEKVKKAESNIPIKLVEIKTGLSGKEIESLPLIDKNKQYLDYFILKKSQNTFTIKYAVLGYFNSSRNSFQYMLEGYDEDWISPLNDVQFASYAKVPFGEYKFKVRTLNPLGTLEENELVVNMIILPYWWESPFAILGYVIIFLGLLILFIRYRERQSTKLRVELEDKIRERTNLLVESQERFELALAGSGDALWEYDSRSKVNWFSPRYIELLGYRQDEISHTFDTWAAHIHPDDKETSIEAFNNHLESDIPYDINYRMRIKGGEYRWFRARAKSTRDKNGLAIRTSGSVSDITIGKENEEELTLLNQLVYGSLDAADIGAFWVDFTEEDTFHSLDKTVNMIGIPVNESGNNYRISDWMTSLVKTSEFNSECKDIVDETLERFSGTVSGKYDVYRATYPILQKDGTLSWVTARADVTKRKSDGTALLMTGTLIDITEIKKGEEELKKINYMSGTALDLTKAGFWTIDYSDPDYFISSRRTSQILGEPEKDDFRFHIIDDWKKHISDADPKYAKDAERASIDAFEGRVPRFDASYPYKRPSDGKTIWVRTIGDIVRDDKGNPITMYGVVQDITDIKDAEIKIQNSEKQLQTLVATIPGTAYRCLMDKDWTMVYLSEEIETLSGYPASDFINNKNRTYESIVHSDDKDFISKATSEAIEKNEHWSMEYRILCNDGLTKWVYEKGNPEYDEKGNIIHLVGTILDISDRKKMEENIKEVNFKSDNALDLTKAGFWTIDYSNPEYYTSSERAADIFGEVHKEGYTYHLTDEWLNRIIEADPEIAEETGIRYGEAVEGQTARYDTIYPYKRPIDNKIVWIRAIGDVIRDENGKALFMYGVAQDITEEKESERALNEARDAAEAATKAKSDFLANMSHEIRTPMNAIIGLSHLIKKTNLSDKQDDYIRKISSSAKSLLGIINDILDFSKIEAGKLSMETIPFNVHEVFDNLGSMIGDKTQDKGLELIFNIGTDVPINLEGDPLRLGQILLNLTNNAVKFTNKGEIAVSVELLKEIKDKVSLKFSVRDTGIGLTKEQQGKLFQAFSQADTSTTRKFGGTGLGLTISKRLSEMMNGDIGVDSIPSVGSTFFFTGVFDIGEEQEKNVVPDDIKELNVLIIDDNETSREVLSVYVKDFSFKSVAVESGKQAVELFESKKDDEKPFDLVLMDCVMPEMNGFETLENINNILKESQKPKYLLVTSDSHENILKKIEPAGFDGFILKPVNQSQLFNSIIEIFGYRTLKGKHSGSEKYPENFDKVRGASILLAEDNLINQQVAMEILEGEGFFVDIADNGQIAIDQNKTKEYDIILMDLQMPILGGYDATREIRKDRSFKNLPIVAMTADAMTGVRDAVIESGMDDYITKPIDTHELWQTLAKWIKPRDRNLPEGYSRDSKDSKEIKKEDLPVIEGVDISTGVIRVGNNVKVYTNLLEQFLTEYKDFKSIIDPSLKNREDSVRVAHTLKGVSGNLGIDGIQEKAKELESGLKNSIPVDKIINRICMELESIALNVNKSGFFIKEVQPQVEKRPISSEELNQKIKIVIDSLERRKPKPAKEILDDLEDFILEDEVLNSIIECKSLLNKYKMKQAITILLTLIIE